MQNVLQALVRNTKPRSKNRLSIGTLSILILFVLYFSYKAGFSNGAETVDLPLAKDSTVEQTVAHVQKENVQLKRKSQAIERHYHIQLEVNKSLTQHIKKLQQNNNELARDIALYQSLAGSLPGKGVHINTFQIFATEHPQKFRYFYIFAKNASQNQVEGNVKMILVGQLGKEQVSIPVSLNNKQSHLKFKFRHLREFQGELALPQGFLPEEVILEVKLDRENQVLRKKFPWVADNSMCEDEEEG